MGRMQAMEMHRMTDEDTMLRWHLGSNHVPALPMSLVPTVKRALAKARRGDWDKKVRLPKGMTHKKHGSLAPVYDVLDFTHTLDLVEGY